MAFNNKDYFTVVEFGTSKISVVHCLCTQQQNPEIVGFGIRDAGNAIVKGDIVNFKAVEKLLLEAFADADNLAKENMAGIPPDRENVYFLVSGPGIRSLSGNGNVELYGDKTTITPETVQEAVRKAMTISLPDNRLNIDTLTSYYILNSEQCVSDPVGHVAQRLDAYICLITAERTRIETILGMLREIGFEGRREPIFSGSAAMYGTLNSDECEHGGLMIDIGAGITEYVFVQNDGVLASGVIPVGMDNLANDLAIALELPIDQMRRLIIDNTIHAMKESNQAFLELGGSGISSRQFSLTSIEDITNKRLFELFTLIRDELNKLSLLPRLRGGVVLTGGGAMFQDMASYAFSVFNAPCRIAVPQGFSGAVTGLNTPRFTAVTGALKYIAEIEAGRSKGSLDTIGDFFGDFAEGMLGQLKNITGVFRK